MSEILTIELTSMRYDDGYLSPEDDPTVFWDQYNPDGDDEVLSDPDNPFLWNTRFMDDGETDD